jgi:hypothetical protein
VLRVAVALAPIGLALTACAGEESGSAGPVRIVRMTSAELLSYARTGGYDYRALRLHLDSAGQAAGARVHLEPLWNDSTWPGDPGEARALWIDAYNAGAIAGVMNRWPIRSVTDVDDYFTAPGLQVAGEWFSLDDIEKDKLFGTDGDARVHFAIVCASESCPPLHPHPFQAAADLDDLLDSLTRAVINDTAFVQLNFEAREARLSRLFDWYADDFETAAGTVMAFIARYHAQGDAVPGGNWDIRFRAYDWSLNQRPRTKP